MKQNHKTLPTTETKLEGIWPYEVVVVAKNRLGNGKFIVVSMGKRSNLKEAEEYANHLCNNYGAPGRHCGPDRDYVVAEWQMIDGEIQLRLTRDPNIT